MRSIGVLVVSFSVILLFQGCSGVGFSQKAGDDGGAAATATDNPLAGGEQDAFGEVFQGLSGGHFDLDTSSAVYGPGAGRTNHHVHEYDDKYNVTYADFFALKDAKFDNIQERVPPSQRFVLVVANAQLSPGAVLSLNGAPVAAVDYQKKVDAFLAGDSAALPVFSLDGASAPRLEDLKVGFARDAIVNGGLIGTSTGCVVANDPGKLGEYRNGALVVQAIRAEAVVLDSVTRVSAPGGGLLWEATIFWHWEGGCYR